MILVIASIFADIIVYSIWPIYINKALFPYACSGIRICFV